MKFKKINLMSFSAAAVTAGMLASTFVSAATKADPNINANIYKGQSADFWKTYQSISGSGSQISTIYQDYSKMPNMGEDQDNNNVVGGPEYAGYAGIAGGDDSPYDYQEIIKDSTTQNLAFSFNVQNIGDNAKYGKAKTYSVMQREGDDLTDPYFAQTATVHNLGGSIDIGYGGDFTWAQGKMENWWTLENNNAAGAKMLEDSILAYGTHQLDFDIEAPTSASADNVDNLMKQVAAVQTDLGKYNWNLGVRWTVMYMDPTYFEKSIKYGVKNFVVNPMLNGSETLDSIKDELQGDLSSIKSDKNLSAWVKGKTDEEIAHHFGYTMWWGTDLNTDDAAKAVGNYFAQKQIGYLGYWAISGDHKKGSIADKDSGHQNDVNKTDYEFSNDIFNSYLINSTWKDDMKATASQVKNLRTSYVTKTDTGITWDKSTNAKYYEILDAKGNVIYKTPKNNFSFDAVTQEYTNVKMQAGKTYNFKVVAVAANGSKSKATSISFNTNSKNLLDQAPNTYNINMQYNTRKNYDFVGQYVAYKGQIYQIVSDVDSKNGTPDKNKAFKKINNVEGLSKDFMAFLASQEQDNAYTSFDFKKLTLKTGQTITAKDLPNVNSALYERLHNRK